MRILMTGFEPWKSIVNNPSGDFVEHVENTTEAMRYAFGDRLNERRTVTRTSEDGEVTMTYAILDPMTGKHQEVEVYLRILPTSNESLDGSEGSIPDLLDEIDPHGVLSMGVGADMKWRTDDHLVETTANNDRLTDNDKPNRAPEKKSRALAGAIKSGSDKIKKERED